LLSLTDPKYRLRGTVVENHCCVACCAAGVTTPAGRRGLTAVGFDRRRAPCGSGDFECHSFDVFFFVVLTNGSEQPDQCLEQRDMDTMSVCAWASGL